MSRGWNGNDDNVGKDEQQNQNRPEGEATVLPAREAMSLITPDPSVGFTPEMGAMPDAGAAQGAAVDAQGSASGGENVTSEDRDDHSENSDSADSQT